MKPLSAIEQRPLDLTISVRDMVRQYGSPTLAVKEVLQKGSHLPTLVKEFGESNVIYLVVQLIKGYCMKFNVSKNMNELQCVDLAMELVEDLSNTTIKGTLEELAIFFNGAAKGDYKTKAHPSGLPFDRIDRGLILDLLDAYFESDRTTAVHAIMDERDYAYKKTQVPLGRTSLPMSIPEIEKNYQGKPMSEQISNVNIPGITKPFSEKELNNLPNQQQPEND